MSKHILLKMEKNNHFKEKYGPWEAFINCLKSIIDLSIEVLEAIYGVETTLPKSSLKTACKILEPFLEYFLLPKIFEIMLINEYYTMDQDCLTEHA